MKAVSQMVDEKLTANVLLNRVHHSRTDFKELDNLISDLEHLERLPFIIPQSALIPKAAFKGEAVKNGNISNKFDLLTKHLKKDL
jgi:chromosome partitioning protein